MCVGRKRVMHIIVRICRLDGQTFFEPISDDAKLICRVTDKPLITKRQYGELRRYGFHVEIL